MIELCASFIIGGLTFGPIWMAIAFGISDRKANRVADEVNDIRERLFVGAAFTQERRP